MVTLRAVTEERRVVTILFADVTGSTALGESLDPEDLRALLGRYYGVAKDVIAAHGGTVEKFIGDAVMAVFGLPVAHGDDAERALAAALELRDRIRDDPKLGERIPVRLGVNTGDVVATRDTSGGDFLITGDAVNVTARLEQNAEPWQILVGERTVHAADRAFEFAPLTTIAAKGKAGGVRAAAIVGRKNAGPRVSVPMIGRAGELAQLELAASRALRDRRPSLVSIVAPAGTGKSRLLEEFIDGLSASMPAAIVATAQCLPYGQRLTYWPLRAVLFRLIGAGEDASPADVRSAIAQWLGDADIPDRERVAELLAATVGASETEVLDRAALFAAWRSAFEVAGQRAPLVIVFEDLHWSSDSLLDLVEFVMQPRGDAPVLTIALTRPELLDRRPGWGGGRRNYTSIALDPLRDDEIGSLVRHLLEASPAEIVERIVARAEGNPFFAGELVRAIVERAGSLTDPAAVERAVAALPDTVQATVLARLDLLPASERRVLQMGAVLGRSFRSGGVKTLAPELDDVDGAIDALIEKDLVRPGSADSVTFRHILIREVAYQTLPRAERARLHARAGEWLEGVSRGNDEAFAELIAFHWREAASLPNADEAAAAEIRRKATLWLRRAAEAAMSSAAQAEARRHLLAAVELAMPDELPEIYERLGDAYSVGSEAADAYRTALRLAREHGRGADQQLRILGGVLMVYMRMQGSVANRPSSEEMQALRDDALATFARATDDAAIARYHAADAFFAFWSMVVAGRPSEESLDEVEAKAGRALEIAERLGDVSLQSASLDAIGSARMLRGDLQSTRALALRRIAMADLGLAERMDAFAVAVWMCVYLGELDEAIRLSDRALRSAQPGQAPTYTLHMVAWRTYAAYLLGDWTEALHSGERMRHLWIEGGRIAAGYAMRGFITAYQAARAMRNAAAAERMREIAEAIGGPFPPGSASREKLALLTPRPDIGRYLETTLSAPAPGPDDVERSVAVSCDLGEPPDLDLLRQALDRLRTGPTPPVTAQAQRAIGLARRDVAALDGARTVLESMGARPFVARARYERALITGERDELSAALADLERIGDLEQVERYEQRARRT